MGIERLLPNDVWIKIDGNNQFNNLELLREYTTTHPVHLDFRDKRLFPFNPKAVYDSSQIYKFDIGYNRIPINEQTPPKIKSRILGAGGQFIVDEEKIAIRAYYPTLDYSVSQRDLITDDFFEFIKEKGVTVQSSRD